MKHPLISAIIPVYNCEKYIAYAVESILGQNYPNLEIIAVNDGSTDGSLAVLKKFGKKIQIISQENKGQAAARNVGVRASKGSIIAFLDADDVWTDDHIERLLPHLGEKSPYDFVMGQTRYVRYVGNKATGEVSEITDSIFQPTFVCTGLYRRAIFDTVGFFDETMRQMEDVDWIMRCLEKGCRQKKIADNVLMHRRHATNMTNSPEVNRRGQLDAFRKKVERQKARSLPEALSKNVINLRKEYLEHVIRPAVTEIAKKISPVSKTYNIAGKIVRCAFYSLALAEKMSRALEHLEIVSKAKPDLVIHLWDSVSAKREIASPWSRSEYFSEHGPQEQEKSRDAFFGAYIRGEETVNIYDASTKSAYFWIHDEARLPGWIMAAPARAILHWFLAGAGVNLVHGAAIGIKGQAVLLTAKSGSGKSTTALSCLMSGMEYLADDYVAISAEQGVLAHSLYSSVKVVPNRIEEFPRMLDMIERPEARAIKGVNDGKAIVFLSKLFPDQIVRQAALKALLIPVIKGGETTRMVSASKMQAMLALMPTTLLQLPLVGAGTSDDLKKLIARLPCYFLELGSDVKEVPETIRSFLLAGQNSSDPLVSVVMPVFNAEKYVKAAIESVFAQTYGNIELICVNDGSSDGSLDVLKSFGDKIVLVDSPKNCGISEARNKGIREAKGELLAFLDADDLWISNKIEAQARQLSEDSALHMSFTYMKHFMSPELPEEIKKLRYHSPDAMLGQVPGAALIRMASFKDVGLFDPKLVLGEFMDWLLRAKEKDLRYGTISETLLLRRIHETNTGITNRSARMDYLKVVRENFKKKKR